MKTLKITVVGSLIAFLALRAGPVGQQGAVPERLGRVTFQTSCSPTVRPQFDRAMALLHSFWFAAAIDAFKGVLAQDPTCGMAHWGTAMGLWGNPFAGGRQPSVMRDGLAAVERAKAAAATTDRERAYIAAAEQLYKDFESVAERARVVAYQQSMQQVYEKYADDSEAAALYALALAFTALPTDQTYANQLKAAAILDKLFAAQPDHPGLAHYIIHANDHPPLAGRALEAARRYATIAPSAPHALHMPSHTFTRVGLWQDSIEANIASAEAARAANSPGEALHALDYQIYAYLQTAQDTAARRVRDDLRALVATLGASGPYGQAGFFARAAIPARYALERGQWAEASSLQVTPSALPHVDAITHFARALGSARSGSPGAARTDIARLDELRNALVKANDQYWAQQVDIQQKVASAWLAYAEGRRAEGIALLREAAALEDSTDKSAITPGPLAPARELLGEMLLDSGQTAEALAEFQATMKKEPNRFRGVLGAARAAAKLKNATLARQYYRQLVEISAAADKPGRAELQEARKVVGAR